MTGARRGRGRPPAGTTAVAEEDVLDAALETFADLGFDGASVRELCRRLGVSHNLLHQRHGSKEQLWFAAVDRGFRHLALEFLDAAGEPEDDDLDRMRGVMVRFVEVTAANPSLLRVIHQESARPGPRLDHIVEAYLRPAIAVMDEVSAGLVAAGRWRPVPTPVVYILVAHGAGGPLSLTALADRLGLGGLRRDPGAVRAYAETVVDAVLAGLAAPA